MRFFLEYIKEKRNACLLAAVCMLLLLFSFALYHLPVRAVLYPAVLCVIIAGGFLIFDVRRAKREHEALLKAGQMSPQVLQALPEGRSRKDEDYQHLLVLLTEEIAALESQANIRYQDMIDYYTLWAHQIKTPIASMRLHLQNEDSHLSRQLQADLLRIEQYVEMVLAFLRLDAETTDYTFGTYELDAMIRQAVKKFSQEFISRKIRLEYEPLQDTFVTDEKWFVFLLEQILSNALKYTREGAVSIVMPQPGMLCIRDTGIGIAPEDLPRIFEKGYTGYNGREDKKASGLGLYLCKRVCDNLGITISAQSRVGKGTTITLCLEQYQLQKE